MASFYFIMFTKFFKILPLFVVILATTSCVNKYQKTGLEDTGDTIKAKYTGSLPCADCSALKMSLLLYKNGRFKEISTYENAPGGNKTFNSGGKWNMQLHQVNGKKDTLLVLHYQKSGNVRYYLKSSPSKIQMLDQNKQIIHSPFNQSLTLDPSSRK